MILSLSCDAPEFLNAIVIIKKVLVIAQIMAPIVLIILSSIDIAKAVMAGNEDDIMRHVRKFPKRLLSLSVIYFVPIIINFTVSLAQDISEYSECYANATEENVLIAYQNKAEDLVATAEKQKTRKSLSSARGYLSRLSDEELVNAFNERLNTVEAAIKAKEDEEKKSRIEKLKEDLAQFIQNAQSVASYGNSSGSIDNPLGLPYYSQCDSRWPCYQGYNSCRAACGYNSLAMVISGLTKDSKITTLTIFKDYNLSGPGCNAGGGYDTFNYVNTYSHGSTSDVVKKYNLKTQAVFGYGSGLSDSQKISKLKDSLRQNHAIILNVPNHYIVLAGIDKNQNIYVLDPANASNNGAYNDSNFINKFKYYNGGSEFRAAYEYYK